MQTIPSKTQNPKFKSGFIISSDTRGSSVFIPWRGKVLTPTPAQILECEGDLNKIYERTGYREPTEREKQYSQIRIPWKGVILVPTPRQMLISKGNLNNLMEYLNTRDIRSFRRNSREGQTLRHPSLSSKNAF